MAEAQGKLTGRPGRLLRHARPGREQRSDRRCTPRSRTRRRWCCSSARWRATSATARRSRRSTTGRCSGPARSASPSGSARSTTPTACPNTWRARSARRCRAAPGRSCSCCPRTCWRRRPRAPVLPRVEPALAWPAPGALRELRAMLLAAAAPVRHRRRQRLDAARVRRRSQRFAENWKLPVGCAFRFQDAVRQPPSELRRRRRHRHQPEARARASRDADLILAIGPRLGEMTTGGYTLLDAAEADAEAGPHPRRRRGARPRLRGRPGDQRVDERAPRRRSRRSTPPPTLPWARVDRGRACRLRSQPRRRRRSSRSTWPRSCRRVERLVPRRQPCFTNGAGNFAGWLHRFYRYAGLRHARPHAARADRRARWATACRRRSPRRCCSRRAPSINIAGDGDFLMTGQELATATAHGAGTATGGSQHRRRQRQLRHDPHAPGARVPRPRQRQRPRATRTSPRSRAPTAGARRARRRRRPRSSRRFAPRSRRRQPTLLHVKLAADVITSRTTITAIRRAAQQRLDAKQP